MKVKRLEKDQPEGKREGKEKERDERGGGWTGDQGEEAWH